jgi:hypothetical protein
MRTVVCTTVFQRWQGGHPILAGLQGIELETGIEFFLEGGLVLDVEVSIEDRD